MLSATIVPYQTDLPDWLALAVVVASILLALLTLSLMLLRLRSASDEEPRTTPAVVRDPVLLVSAVGVILLAIAAWLLR